MTAADTQLVSNRIILRCRGITKSYGGVAALRGVDLDVEAGSIHGLVGPNGAGKSSVVKIIAGAVSSDDGTIEFQDEVLHTKDPHANAMLGILLIPQELTTVASMTVAENITLGNEAMRRGLRSATLCRIRAQKALSAIGLDVSPDALTGTLSPSHQRLVMIARAFDRDSKVVILDEPTAGLPAHEATLVIEATKRLAAEGIGVLYISHHLSEVAQLCSTVTCIREGRNVGSLRSNEITKTKLVAMIHDAVAEEPNSASEPRPVQIAGRPVIELRSVSSARLRDVSVTFPSGHVTGIAGLLGSGDKELIGLIAGVIHPSSGEILVDRKAAHLSSPSAALSKGITYLAGDRSRSAIHGRSIRENVSISALSRWTRWGVLRTRDETRNVTGQLAGMHVTAQPTRLIGELSGGNQQRALIARCLSANPALVVLDEPTIGVDVAARADLWHVVRQMARERAVVVGSGDTEELVALCDRVICVKDGRIMDILEGGRLNQHAITTAIS